MAKHPAQEAEEAISDDRPLAVRRKRRTSSGQAASTDETGIPEMDNQRNSHGAPSKEPRTPTKPKKRVRFSDPGPDIPTTSSSSTGLTPHIKRTLLTTTTELFSSPAPQLLAAKPRRRSSLPAKPGIPFSSPPLTPSATSCLSGEVQISSLRQALDERTKRRLRRNHMSQEINDIDDEKRSKQKLTRQIEELKTELAVARQLGKEVAESTHGAEEGTERIQELEIELRALKEEMRERSIAADPFASDKPFEACDIFCDPSPPHAGSQNNNADDDSIFCDPIPPHSSSQIGKRGDDNLATVTEGSSNILRELSHFPSALSAAEANSQLDIHKVALHTHRDDLHSALRAARLSLEHLFPGETGLGLHVEEPKLILDNMLDRLRSLKAQAFLAENALSTSRSQESNMRNQFNAVLEQLDRSRKAAELVNIGQSAEKTRANQAEHMAQSLEAVVEQKTLKVKELETDVDEKQRSIQKLQEALVSYRAEVGKLESLITEMEADHNTAFARLQGDMDEAVADLECHVVAETTGRRAAEKEAVERAERIKQLEALEQELKDVVNEKQQIIRALEDEVLEAKEAGEKEVGSLNVEVGKLSSSLEDVQADIAKIDHEKSQITKMLEEEKVASSRALEAVQREMAQCVEKLDSAIHMEMTQCMEKVDGVKVTYVKDAQRRGAEVAEHKGLLTPVTACRFKDGFNEVEGRVEMKRGKATRRTRPDSGVVLEEDEDEEMLDG